MNNMTDKPDLILDRDIPLECKQDYINGEYYEACELMEYYRKWWKKEEYERDKI